MNHASKQNLDWFPMPADIERGSKAKTMALPPIRPPQYGSWKDFQQAWFWNLLFASAKYGGLLPAGSDLWQIAGSLTRARWDANRAAVLDAFGCTQPDADGRFCIYYPPLLEILRGQEKKYRKKIELDISETSTVLHRGCGGPSPSIPLFSDFDLDSKNQDQDESSCTMSMELPVDMSNEHNLSQKAAEQEHRDITAAGRRILDILKLPDSFLAAALTAIEVELKRWSNLSIDGAVQNITNAAHLAERKRVSREEFLGDFPLQKLAKRMLETLNLPITDSNVIELVPVIKAEARDTGLSIEETAIRITQAALEARPKGMAINIFYFKDMKWRSNASTNKAEQRKLNNLGVNARVKQRLREKLGAP